MYATFVKLRYAWTAIAFAIIIIGIGIWYTQPTDIYGLDTNLYVEAIQISLTQTRDSLDEDGLESRSVSFRQGEEGFGEALSRVEAMEFKRPFKNLLPELPFLKKQPKVKAIEDYEYHLTVELFGPEDRTLTLRCHIDEWEYRKSVYDGDLPLKVTANTESPRSFGDHFWEMAQ